MRVRQNKNRLIERHATLVLLLNWRHFQKKIQTENTLDILWYFFRQFCIYDNNYLLKTKERKNVIYLYHEDAVYIVYNSSRRTHATITSIINAECMLNDVIGNGEACKWAPKRALLLRLVLWIKLKLVMVAKCPRTMFTAHSVRITINHYWPFHLNP